MLAEIVLSCCVASPLFTSGYQSLRYNPAFPSSATEAAGDCAGEVPGGAGILPRAVNSEPSDIHWLKLGRDSIRFLTIMHAFRWVTEAGTRSGGIGLGQSYVHAAGNLHGWDDGDPFYVNYVGHPMQGAVSGRLFLINNPRFDREEFGASANYWKGKLRAGAFAWAFSEQFEIGPISEASIGHIQALYPQQGLVDHVVTPVMGLAWMVGEDAIDRYFIHRIEDHTRNKWIRMALRAGLNPSRSLANIVDGRAPWERGSRAGVLTYVKEPDDYRPAGFGLLPENAQKPAPFEFSVAPSWRRFGDKDCMGGGAEAAYRILPDLQLLLDVNGCKLLGLSTDLTGDALIFQIGPRWAPVRVGKWSPYVQFLVGGIKVTHDLADPEKTIAVEQAYADDDGKIPNKVHDLYTTHPEATSLALSAGTGVDYTLNAALAFRVAGIEYVRSGISRLGAYSYASGLQVTTGVTLRLGTW